MKKHEALHSLHRSLQYLENEQDYFYSARWTPEQAITYSGFVNRINVLWVAHSDILGDREHLITALDTIDKEIIKHNKEILKKSRGIVEKAIAKVYRLYNK